MNILVISSREDFHARAVLWALRSRGCDAHLLDLFDAPSQRASSLSPLSMSSQLVVSSRLAGESISTAPFGPANAISTVWYRRFPGSAFAYDLSKVHPDDVSNVVPECDAFFDDIKHLLVSTVNADARWLNHPYEVDRARSKAYQLRVAAAAGFSVPDTLMGNDPSAIRSFFAKHRGEVVVKPFRPKGWREAGAFHYQPTWKLQAEHLLRDQPLMLCPGIYQQSIPKSFELRVFVAGERIVAAKLHSQQHGHTTVDWRLDAHRGQMNIEPFVLDGETQRLVLDFMRRMRLSTGSLDLIVSPSGEVVFLEVNQQGQFLFLERQCPELRLLAEMCNLLAFDQSTCTLGDWPGYSDFLASDEGSLLYADFIKTANQNRQQ